MTTELEHRLRHDLRAVDDAPLDGSVRNRIGEVLHRRDRRRRAGIGIACLALIGAGVVGVALAGNDEPTTPATAPPMSTAPPATTPTATAPPTAAPSSATPSSGAPATTAADTAPPDDASPIVEIADDPRGAVDRPAAVWTGSEIISAAGTAGFGDHSSFVDGGSAYDPATDTWRSISGPGTLITDEFAPVETIEVWTGDQMLVLADNERGARYVAATDTWNRLEFPFDGDITADTPHVWTGDEWLVWSDSGPVAYSPTAQKWRAIAAPPVAGRKRAASVWSGTEWIVWGGRTTEDTDDVGELGDGAAYDPATDTWRIIAEAPIGPRWVDGVWAGGELFVQTGARGPANGSFALDDGAAYDPATDTWRALAPGPAHPGNEMATSGRQIFAVAKRGVGIYDIATDTWTEACCVTEYASGPVLWAGDRLVMLGGATPSRLVTE